jgi:amino acid transporter
MGVGGMIGGGIFSVLGVAISLAGNLAFGCFVLGGLLAAGTAWSYAGVAARTGDSGGPFAQLRAEGHAALAGWLLWLLVFGYVVAMAVYTFTFGRYAATALGLGDMGARVLSFGVVALFVAVNLRGVELSAWTEDVVVFTKIAVLAVIGAVGVAQFHADALSPLLDRGVSGLFLGAATVFFAYEGFELISYDVGDVRNPARTVPRALVLSVAIVAAIYIIVTLGAQMLVDPHRIVANKETAFVLVGRAALGTAGRWAAIAGALLATSSAIHATLFSTARLVRDGSSTGELPRGLGAVRGTTPVGALAFMSSAGLALAMLPAITSLIALGSAAFLAVYVLVNYLQARAATTAATRGIAVMSGLGCAGAFVLLVVELARDDLVGLVVLVLLACLIAAGRLLVRRRMRGAEPDVA